MSLFHILASTSTTFKVESGATLHTKAIRVLSVIVKVKTISTSVDVSDRVYHLWKQISTFEAVLYFLHVGQFYGGKTSPFSKSLEYHI